MKQNYIQPAAVLKEKPHARMTTQSICFLMCLDDETLPFHGSVVFASSVHSRNAWFLRPKSGALLCWCLVSSFRPWGLIPFMCECLIKISASFLVALISDHSRSWFQRRNTDWHQRLVNRQIGLTPFWAWFGLSLLRCNFLLILSGWVRLRFPFHVLNGGLIPILNFNWEL